MRASFTRGPLRRYIPARSGLSDQKGFGKKGTLADQAAQGGKRRRDPRFIEEIEDETGGAVRKPKPKGDYWFKAADLQDVEEKGRKAIVTKSGRALMLWWVQGRAYCTDANSTAFSFPLIDADVVEGESGPAVTTPLDGTVYELATGEVLEWCPKGNPIRSFLSVLKSTTSPINLPVFDCVLTYEDEIYVKLTKTLAAGTMRV